MTFKKKEFILHKKTKDIRNISHFNISNKKNGNLQIQNCHLDNIKILNISQIINIFY